MENFIHAVFEEAISPREVEKLKALARKEIKRGEYKIQENFDIISAGNFITTKTEYITFREGKEIVKTNFYKEFVPVFQIGIKADNLIALMVSYQWQSFPSCRPRGDDELLYRMEEEVEKLFPARIIKGRHNCFINCSECCDSPAYDNFIVRRYCKYASEIGWYCLPLLTNSLSWREKICNEYWCSSLREPGSIRIDEGPYGMRPLLKGIFSYPKKKRKEFLEVLQLIEEGEDFERACSRLERYKEVKMLEELTKELIAAAESCGIDIPLENFPSYNRKEDFERSFEKFKKRGMESKIREQLLKFRKWEEIYKKRKGMYQNS